LSPIKIKKKVVVNNSHLWLQNKKDMKPRAITTKVEEMLSMQLLDQTLLLDDIKRGG
jgi:hypothetical protein